MAFSPRLVYLAILVLASHVMSSNASVRVWKLWGSGLSGDALGNRPDPYVKVWCGGVSGGRTETSKNTNSPSWDAEFNFPKCEPKSTLKLEVWDEDLFIDDLLGTCSLLLSSGSFTNVRCSLKKGYLYFNYTARMNVRSTND